MAKITPPVIPAGSDPTGLVGRVIQWLVRELGNRPLKTEAVDEVLLTSPNRAVYSVKVNDSGSLTTTRVSNA